MKSLFKAIGWTVAMLLIVPNLCAQSVQHGLVQEYRGSEPKTPLKNVSVAAANASAAISDDKGEFTLNFRTLHPGDAIQFRRVELNGYEVMNTEALEVARVARDFNDNANPNANLLRPQDARTEGSNPNTSLNGKPSTLNIVMIRKEALRQLRDGYRSVAAQRYEKQLKASTEEIERLKKAGQLAEEQYNERMNALEEAYEDKLTKLETYIDKFARIDLSDLDQDEQQIIDLVQAGNFDEALDLYDKQNLADRLRQSREDQQKLVSMRDQLDEAAHKKALENQRLRQSIGRQVTLLRMAGGDENFMKAHMILKETFLADTTDWNARVEYAVSLEYYGQHEEERRILESGIFESKDNFAKGMMSLQLADVFYSLGQMERTYQSALNAECLLMPLKDANYVVLTRGLPVWCSWKIQYFIQQRDLKSCTKVLDEVVRLWSPDTTSVQSVRSYITLLGDMSDAYSQTLNHQQSIWCARESVRLGQILNRTNPWDSKCISVYANSASIFAVEGKIEDAVSSALVSAKMIEESLQKSNTRVKTADAVSFYYLLAESLVPAGQYALVDSILNQASDLMLFDRLKECKDDLSQMYGALIHIYQAQVWLQKGQIEEAEKMAEDAFSVLKTSEEGAILAEVLQLEMESRFCLAKHEYIQAKVSCQKLVDKCCEIYGETQDAWEADSACRSYLLLYDILFANGESGKAKKALKQAQKYALFESNEQAINLRINQK